MKEQEIIAGNRLIAEFMGGERREMASLVYYEFPGQKKEPFDYELKYHASWDTLMPVAQKLRDLMYAPKDDALYYAYKGSKIESALLSIEIKQLWEAAIGLIKWCNSNSVLQSNNEEGKQ